MQGINAIATEGEDLFLSAGYWLYLIILLMVLFTALRFTVSKIFILNTQTKDNRQEAKTALFSILYGFIVGSAFIYWAGYYALHVGIVLSVITLIGFSSAFRLWSRMTGQLSTDGENGTLPLIARVEKYLPYREKQLIEEKRYLEAGQFLLEHSQKQARVTVAVTTLMFSLGLIAIGELYTAEHNFSLQIPAGVASVVTAAVLVAFSLRKGEQLNSIGNLLLSKQ